MFLIGIDSMHFYVTWFPFWSYTHLIQMWFQLHTFSLGVKQHQKQQTIFCETRGSTLCKLKSSELDKMLMSKGSLHRCSVVDNFRASGGNLLEFPLLTLISVASLWSSH